MSLRVLHVLCDLSPGGAERLVLEICRRRSPDLARLGHHHSRDCHDGGVDFNSDPCS